MDWTSTAGTLGRWLRGLLARQPRFTVQRRVPCEVLGTEYGGYAVCLEGLSRSAVVYSCGVGEDISFDRALIDRAGVEVHAFDPTPRALAWARAQDLPAAFHLHPFAVWNRDEMVCLGPPRKKTHVSRPVRAAAEADPDDRVQAYRLATIMRRLGHATLDLLKLDVEGAEYAILEDLLAGDIRPRQILLEFHHRFREVGPEKTINVVRQLNRAGYQIFHVCAKGEQYSFLR